jgi:hypothetical protein
VRINRRRVKLRSAEVHRVTVEIAGRQMSIRGATPSASDRPVRGRTAGRESTSVRCGRW